MNTLPSAFNEAVFVHRRSVVSVEGVGTGFFMGSAFGQSLVMTAEHVVRDSLTTREGEVTVHVPSVGSARGRVIFHDEGADVAVIMISVDSGISGEGLRYSDIAVASGRDVVMLGYFSKGSDIIIQPGMSHGYAKGTISFGNVQYLAGSFTGKGGNSGSSVFVVENGAGAIVVGMYCHELILENKATGKLTRHQQHAITVASIQSSLRNKLGPAVQGMTIQEMVPMIIQIALRGPPGGADG